MTERSVLTRLKADVSDFNRGMLAASAGAKAFTKELDTGTDRSTMLVQSLLAVGPALVPIGAAAVPAISGLTNQLAFAAAGAGVTALAFSGVGDALKAVNDYQLEPTTANFEKMSETMRELGPAGREFVRFLQEIRPEMQGLQDAAQAGLLPGAEEGIRELMQLMPQAERIVSTIASTIGDLIAEAGDNLNDPRWVEFFTFLEDEARPTLLDMGRTLGNFAEGFANLWMAFDPMSDDFSAGFLRMSRDFAAWTDGLSETEGFQEFLDYVSRVGPKVWDTLGALGNALVEIVEAAAPVGEATLPIIEAVADVLASIADSPVGPALIGAAAGIAAVSRAVALYNVANGAALTGMLTRLGGGSGALARAGAGIGVLALSMTDLDEKMGVSNTAMFGLAGAMTGPLGAAVGVTIGGMMDLVALNDEMTDSFAAAGEAINGGTASLEEQAAALQNVREVAGAGDSEWSKVQSAALGVLEGQYQDNVRAAQDLAYEEAGLGNSMDGASDAARSQVDAILMLIDARNRAADQALTARDAERGYEAAIDDARDAIRKNGKATGDATPAARDNARAIDAIADAWNKMDSAGQQAKGGIGAARREFISAAVAAGYTRAEARKLAAQLLKIKPPPPLPIKVNTADALNKLHGIQQYINGMNGKTIRIAVERGAPGGITRNAEGGYIRGPGTTTSDSIPALLSDKEYVIKASSVEKYGVGMMHAINAGQYANGGYVRPTRFADGGSVGGSASSSEPTSYSLVGARAKLVGPNLVEFVDGRVEKTLSKQQRFAKAQKDTRR